MKKKYLSTVYLRFHARIIIAIIAFSTFLFSHLLLKYLSLNILSRYPLAALGSYGVFVLLMHAWKMFLEDLQPSSPIVSELVQSDKNPELPFRWHDYVSALDVASLDDFFIAIGIIALMIILFYSVGVVLFEIPFLMTDLVLSGLASSLLIRSIHKADNDIFAFKIIRQTLGPGLLYILIYFLVALAIHNYCPLAVKFSDIITGICVSSSGL